MNGNGFTQKINYKIRNALVISVGIICGILCATTQVSMASGQTESLHLDKEIKPDDVLSQGIPPEDLKKIYEWAQTHKGQAHIPENLIISIVENEEIRRAKENEKKKKSKEEDQRRKDGRRRKMWSEYTDKNLEEIQEESGSEETKTYSTRCIWQKIKNKHNKEQAGTKPLMPTYVILNLKFKDQKTGKEIIKIRVRLEKIVENQKITDKIKLSLVEITNTKIKIEETSNLDPVSNLKNLFVDSWSECQRVWDETQPYNYYS